jgi:hypothetical protein
MVSLSCRSNLAGRYFKATSLPLGHFLPPTRRSKTHKPSLFSVSVLWKERIGPAFETAFERKFLLKLLENGYTNGRSKSSCLEEASIYSLRWFFLCVEATPTSQDRVE